MKEPINFRNFIGGDIQSQTRDCTYRGRIVDVLAHKEGRTYRIWVEICPLLELRNPTAASKECRGWAPSGETSTVMQKFEDLKLQQTQPKDGTVVLFSNSENLTLFPPGHHQLLNYEEILQTHLVS